MNRWRLVCPICAGLGCLSEHGRTHRHHPGRPGRRVRHQQRPRRCCWSATSAAARPPPRATSPAGGWPNTARHAHVYAQAPSEWADLRCERRAPRPAGQRRSAATAVRRTCLVVIDDMDLHRRRAARLAAAGNGPNDPDLSRRQQPHRPDAARRRPQLPGPGPTRPRRPCRGRSPRRAGSPGLADRHGRGHPGPAGADGLPVSPLAGTRAACWMAVAR